MASFIDDNCSSSNPIHTINKRKRKGNNGKKEISIGGGSGSGSGSSSYSLTFHGHDDAAALLSLPEDILILIVKKLDCVGFHRFSAACRFFCYSVAAAAKKMQVRRHHQNQFPWLMLPFDGSMYIETPLDPHPHSHNPYHDQGFFSALHGEVFRLRMLPMADTICCGSMADTICCGSNLGWLILYSWSRGRIFLFNPITGVQIELPRRLPRESTFYWPVTQEQLTLEPANGRDFIRKVILLSPAAAGVPTTNHSNSKSNNNIVDDCLILAIYWKNLVAFCKPGDKAWTGFTKHYVADDSLRYEDFIVYDGKLYAIKCNYDLVLVELGVPDQPKETSCNIAPLPPLRQVDMQQFSSGFRAGKKFRHLYLVECDGELLMVIRCGQRFTSRHEALQITLMLEIFKLEIQHLRWVQVDDLGDQMIFLGLSTSFSMSSLHCPGFKGNCVYFADGYLSGVYHLEDNTCLKPFYTTYLNDCNSVEAKSLPIWFTPNSW